MRRKKEAKQAGSGWGCPHDDKGTCGLRGLPCAPLEKGCVLEGRGSSAPGPEGLPPEGKP